MNFLIILCSPLRCRCSYLQVVQNITSNLLYNTFYMNRGLINKTTVSRRYSEVEGEEEKMDADLTLNV